MLRLTRSVGASLSLYRL